METEYERDPTLRPKADADAIERAKRCVFCKASTAHVVPLQRTTASGRIVEWDIRCPACRKTFWIDMRATEYAEHSPFYGAPALVDRIYRSH
jgi:uncharacterized protein with PIN domain